MEILGYDSDKKMVMVDKHFYDMSKSVEKSSGLVKFSAVVKDGRLYVTNSVWMITIDIKKYKIPEGLYKPVKIAKEYFLLFDCSLSESPNRIPDFSVILSREVKSIFNNEFDSVEFPINSTELSELYATILAGAEIIDVSYLQSMFLLPGKKNRDHKITGIYARKDVYTNIAIHFETGTVNGIFFIAPIRKETGLSRFLVK